MLRINEVRLPFDHAEEALSVAVRQVLGVGPDDLKAFRVVRKSVDARKRAAILFVYMVDVEVEGEADVLKRCGGTVRVAPQMRYAMPPRIDPANVADEGRPVVVGAGPCGLFAALLLARCGYRPILIERGGKATERAKAVRGLWVDGELDPASNVQFGEGGAGTFSDGKLTTQIKDRENRCRKVLEEMIEAGAPEDIIFRAKPHIGTDKLIEVVGNLRREIEALGGEVRFREQVLDLIVEDGCVRGVRTFAGSIPASAVVMAIGHSARDTFEALHRRGARMEAKAFSIGVRIEHPQSLIDQSQYGRFAGDSRLGAAEYKLVHHCKSGRSVYSFCMCPGGRVIAAASEAGGVVTNGMSNHARSGRNGNAGLLVGVGPEDYAEFASGENQPPELAGVAFQRHWEQRAFAAGGGGYRAPAQRLEDFMRGRATRQFGEVVPSYLPGVEPVDLKKCLPGFAVEAMREAVPMLDRKLKGFAMPDAVLTGVETRSSSPVRIVRDPQSFESVTLSGLYPAGEGAGYAGGIMSAAVDGMRVAEAVIARITAE